MSPAEAIATSATQAAPRNFRVEVEDGVATLLLDVPGESLNVLGNDVAEEFAAELARFERDPAVRGIVLASGKKDSFIAGARIDEFQSARTAADAEKLSRGAQAHFDKLEAYPKPIVVAIHGICLGGGLELGLLRGLAYLVVGLTDPLVEPFARLVPMLRESGLFSWKEGSFSFSDGEPTDLDTDAAIRVSTESLLMEGARRIDEWSRMADRLPDALVVPGLAPAGDGPESSIDLSEDACAEIDAAFDVLEARQRRREARWWPA